MNEVLIQYATYVLPEDITLGLAILLILKNPCDAKKVLDSFPVSLATLRTAIYYFALQILFSEPQYSSDMGLFTKDLDEITQLALNVKTDSEMHSILHEYRNKLQDFCQAEELHTLGCGVDIQRFANDENYRRDSILGLSMSPDLNRYNLALKLGNRHNINLSSIAFEHASSLLQSSEIDLKKVSDRLEDKGLLQLLKEQPDITCERLLKEVFPTLDGSEHNILIVYFTLTDRVNPDYLFYGLLSKEHIKLLKKIKSACPTLNYAILLTPPENFVSQITSNLLQDDLPVLYKFLKSLPTQLLAKCQYTQSLLYKEWCKKHMSEIQINSPLKEYEKHWNDISPLFSKINAEDFKMFVYHITLNSKLINKIDILTRLTLLKHAITYCNERTKQDRIEGWSFTHSEFTEWESLLETLRSEPWQNLSLHGDIQHILKIIQGSCTDKDLLLSGYIELLLIDNISLEDIIIAMKSISGSPTLLFVITHLINTCCKNLNSTESLNSLSMVATRLERFLISSSSEVVKTEADFASGDWDNEWNIDESIDEDTEQSFILCDKTKKELADVLLPLCGDSRIPSTLRLRFMKIIQDLNISSDSEVSSLMLYQHTQATVSSAWNIEQDSLIKSDLAEILSNMELTTEQGRYKVFQHFLDKVSNWDHVECLSELLSYWPKFSIEHYCDINSPWSMLLEKILNCGEIGQVENVYSIMMKILDSGDLSELTIENMHKKYESKITEHLGILFDLIFYKNNESTSYLRYHAVEIINKLEQPLEETILKLIASKHLAQDIVQSKSYKSLLELSLISSSMDSNESDFVDPENIVKDLLNARLTAEAGSFSLSSIGTPASLRSFSAAVEWAKRLYATDDEE
ncbi:neuroblastoma-amplified sequence-like [Ctenocephalides felis]|uniref:neuroblastoma-amplified sequence-like n=1 Tax=Ctenocephalides felis TaxID=7515 RepID=UPI000E6E2374|nr:neuroblastoma-amplified sequence-like [Ctenocephalides felis]